MDYIRTTYRVPAKRGGRVEYTHPVPPRTGTIVGSRGARLRIRLDGDTNAGNYHPTWQLCYLAAAPAAQSSTKEPGHE